MLKRLNLGLYQHKTNNMVVHRTLLKVMINPILRGIQRWTDTPYVIASVFAKGVFVRYSIQRVRYIGPADFTTGDFVKIDKLEPRNNVIKRTTKN